MVLSDASVGQKTASSFHEIVQGLGQFGRYQFLQFTLVALVCTSSACQILVPIFILWIPKHRCAVPGLANDTYHIQDEQHGKLVTQFIPMTSSPNGGMEYSSCEVYSGAYLPALNGLDRPTQAVTEEFLNRSEVSGKPLARENSTQSCSQWVYDKSVFSLTASSQFDLVCGRQLFKSHLVMALMSGQMVGTLFTGPLTDHFGRKISLLVALASNLLISVSIAFAFHVYLMAALYFLNGAIISCMGCSSYTLAMELVGPRWRHVAGIAIFFFWTLGMALLALLAFVLRDWTHLQLAISCPIVLYMSYYFLVNESARWLHSKGRFRETRKVLEKAAATNGVKLDLDKVQDLESDGQVETESIFSIFKYRALIGRLFIICINWLVCSLTYYGLSLNVGSLSGNIFLNFFLAAVFEAIGYVILILLLTKLGRKVIYCGSMILAGSACLLTIFPVLYGDGDTLWTVRMLANIGKLGIAAAFGLIWMYTSELFPTSFRASVMSVGSFFARVGAISASYIAFLGSDDRLQKVMPQIVFGIGGLVVGVVALLLPETRRTHLPQCARDATRMTDVTSAQKISDKKLATSTTKPLIKNNNSSA